MANKSAKHVVSLRPAWPALLVALLVGSTVGCWQEIHYTEPKSADSTQPARPTATTPNDSSSTPPVGTSNAAESPATLETSAPDRSLADDDDRYAPTPVAVPTVDRDRYAATPVDQPDTDDDRYATAAAEPSKSTDDYDRYATADTEEDEPSDDLFGEAVAVESAKDTTTASAPAADAAPEDDLFGSTDVAPKPAEASQPTEAPVAAPRDVQLPNTRRMTWLLGSKLSLAALADDRGAPADQVQHWFDQAQRLAERLGTHVAEFPPHTGSGDKPNDSGRALGYLFQQGKQVGSDLATRYGDQYAALFELAVKSNILLVLYQPGAPVAGAIGAALRQASQRAQLPAELCQPLLEKLAAGAPIADVQQTVFRLHDAVDAYLATQPASP